MTEMRQLTEAGIERARDFLEQARTSRSPTEAPDALLFDAPYSQPLADAPGIEARSFETRRDAAEYLAPLVTPIVHQAADHAGIWSWLGMFYLHGTLWDQEGRMRPRNWPEPTAFIFDRSGRSWQRRYRHYLWSSWRLHQAHGERAAYLLDRDLSEFSNLTSRALGYSRVFNSVGIVPLMLTLYTAGSRQKPRHRYGRGGLEHLIRVLDQLERIYDIYGMEAERLLEILPADFERWKSGE